MSISESIPERIAVSTHTWSGFPVPAKIVKVGSISARICARNCAGLLAWAINTLIATSMAEKRPCIFKTLAFVISSMGFSPVVVAWCVETQAYRRGEPAYGEGEAA